MRGRSRASEFEAVLFEIVEIAIAERADVLIVCGDIWDTPSPSPESDQLLHETLRRLITAGVQVLLLAGNHDSPRKLEALGRISNLLNVYTQHAVQPPDAGGVLTLHAGDEEARIAAVPWISEGRLINAEELIGLEPGETHQKYGEGVGRIYRAMCNGFEPSTINLIAGHLFVDGARLAAVDGSERLLHIGQGYGVPPGMLPGAPQYLALGHIHEPQELRFTAAPGAYSGSILQLDFGERGQQKVVRLIEASAGTPAQQHAVPLTAGRPLVELQGPIAEVLGRAGEAAGGYARVILEVERPEAGLAQQVREAIPTVVDVRLKYEHERALPEAELAQLSPRELFVRYYAAQHNAAPAEELTTLFNELVEQATAPQ